MVVDDAGERSFHLARLRHMYRELNPYAGSQSSGSRFNGARGHSARGTPHNYMQAGQVSHNERYNLQYAVTYEVAHADGMPTQLQH